MIIAVDPGKSGAIVWEIEDGSLWISVMPETRGDAINLGRKLTIGAFKSHELPVVYIEKITGFVAGAGAGQMFQFGAQVERIGCIFETLGCRLIEVTPQTWQKYFGFGTKGTVKMPRRATDEVRKQTNRENAARKRDWKNNLKAEAQRRFPNVNVTLENADALLIFEYARAQERGGIPEWAK